MEVKVWMDGIQRVVCGVTDQTTCRDVMIAIAHATGKTGKYTMIEKWLENERNLSASDYPLQILHKWAEYGSEVQFILRHAGLMSSNGRSDFQNDKILHRIHPPRQESGPIRRKIKKSLTFNGATYAWPLSVAHSPLPSSQNNGEMHVNHSLESSEQSSIASHSSTSISPYSSLEYRPQKIFENKPVHDIKSHSPNSHSTSKRDFLPVKKPSPCSSSQKTIDSPSRASKPSHLPLLVDSSKPSQNSPGKRNLSELNQLLQKESSCETSLHDLGARVAQRSLSSDSTSFESPASSSLASPLSTPIKCPMSTPFKSRVSTPSKSPASVPFKTKSPVSTPIKSPMSTSIKNHFPVAVPIKSTAPKSSVPCVSISNSVSVAGAYNEQIEGEEQPRSYQENLQKFRKLAEEQKSSSATAEKPVRENKLSKQSEAFSKKFQPRTFEDKMTDSNNKDNLVKLVNRQRSEIESQGSQIASLNTEIYILEMDLEEDDRQLETTSMQLEELEAAEKELESEIHDLELVSWEDKIFIERSKEMKIKTELTLLNSSIATSELEIFKLESKREEIESRMLENIEQLKKKEESKKDLHDLGVELLELKSHVKSSNITLEGLTNDSTTAEMELSKKLSQLVQLEEELKDVSSELFRLHGKDEDKKDVERLDSLRPGSLRKPEEMRIWSQQQRGFTDASNHRQGYLV